MLRRIDSPGKFEGGLIIDERLYEVSLNGCCEIAGDDNGTSATLIDFEGGHGIADDNLTDDERAFLASQAGAILHEDSCGFVHIQYFKSRQQLEAAWETACADLEPADDDDDDDQDDDDQDDDDEPSRTHYLNGDEISLAGGCDGCSPCMVNGVLCHEHGCPDAWRDQPVACFECGCDFLPSDSGQRTCPDCLQPEYDD